jgi:phosphoglycolate phosphatase
VTKPVRLVVFDCDGTLVDSQHIIIAAMELAFRRLGLTPLTPAEVRNNVGLSLEQTARLVLPDDDEEQRQALIDGYRAAFFELKHQPEHSQALFPGARELLDELRRRELLLAVATGKSRHGLRSTLEDFGLLEYFTSLQTADDAPSKPHPGMILNAMEQTGSNADETLMVGDTSFDIEAGVNAGARSIGVSWGYHPSSALREAGAEAIVDRFDELLPLLDLAETESTR